MRWTVYPAADSAVRMQREAGILLPLHDKSLLNMKNTPE